MPAEMPERVKALRERGFATWAGEGVRPELKERFDAARIPIRSIRNVRVWGLQVDDERELPGHERTLIPDEELWEVTLEATDGSCYAFDSALLRPAD